MVFKVCEVTKTYRSTERTALGLQIRRAGCMNYSVSDADGCSFTKYLSHFAGYVSLIHVCVYDSVLSATWSEGEEKEWPFTCLQYFSSYHFSKANN